MNVRKLANARKLAVILFLSLIFQNVATAQDLEWISQFGTPDSDIAGGVAADSGGVYAAGSTIGVFPGQSAAGGIDVYLRKYSFTGPVLWTRQFGTTADDDTIGPSGAVATDGTGVYIGGTTDGSLPGQTTAGRSDAFVRKYSPSGGLIWTRQFGTAEEDIINGIVVHSSGVYITGETGGTFPGEPTGSGVDIFVAKLAPDTGNTVWIRQYGVRGSFSGVGGFNGNVVWTRQFGSRLSDIALDLAPVGNSVYALGDTACRIGPSQTLIGVRDAYLTQISVNPTSPAGKIQLIVGQLETRSDAGSVGPQEFDSLVDHLENALVALNQENKPLAKQHLGAFVTAVETLASQGGLPSTEAKLLVAAANDLTAQL